MHMKNKKTTGLVPRHRFSLVYDYNAFFFHRKSLLTVIFSLGLGLIGVKTIPLKKVVGIVLRQNALPFIL